MKAKPKSVPRLLPPEFDDRLRPMPEDAAARKETVSAFVLTRLKALEQPSLEEELVEPDQGNEPCSCNSVCACVPDEACSCNQVCTCDTVESCASYSSGGGGGGGGGYYAPCW